MNDVSTLRGLQVLEREAHDPPLDAVLGVVGHAAGGAGTQPGGCLALVGDFAEVDVPAVVAALADDLGQDEGDPRVLPLRDCLERTHMDQLEQVPPQLPYLEGYVRRKEENHN